MIKVFSYVGDNCFIKRQGDKLICSTRDEYSGLKLSDERVFILFNVYAKLMDEERNAEKIRNRESAD